MVTTSLSLALIAYFATMLHRLETYTPQINRTDYSHVVVAGAWRLPDGALSATFARRVERGDELAKQFNATLVFTGGLGDSFAAREYSTCSGALYENKSRTTLQNAIETARIIDPTAVLVVSSPYHLGRCLVYFQRAFPNAAVDVAAAPPDSARGDGSCRKFAYGFYWAKTCVLGMPYMGSIRELGAWAKNIAQGHLSFRGDATGFLKRLDLKKKGVASATDAAPGNDGASYGADVPPNADQADILARFERVLKDDAAGGGTGVTNNDLKEAFDATDFLLLPDIIMSLMQNDRVKVLQVEGSRDHAYQWIGEDVAPGGVNPSDGGGDAHNNNFTQ